MSSNQTSNYEGGIKQELIENANEQKDLIDMVICCICIDLVKIPWECSVCEALYCKDCWENLKVTKKKCAFNCQSEVKPVNKYFREKVLSKIRLRCENCEAANLDYNLYLKHISYCKQHSNFVIKSELDDLIKEKEKRIQELKEEIRKNKSILYK
jgi:hypothetical protein